MNVLPYYTDHQIIILGKIYYRFRSIRRFDSFFVKFSSQFGSFRASPRHMLPRRSGTLAAAGVPFRARSVLRLGNMSRRGSTRPSSFSLRNRLPTRLGISRRCVSLMIMVPRKLLLRGTIIINFFRSRIAVAVIRRSCWPGPDWYWSDILGDRIDT